MKTVVFDKTVFRKKVFEPIKIVTCFGHHRVPIVETRTNIRMSIFKVQCQILASGEGHVRSHDEPSSSRCISVDVSMQGKQIETIPSYLSRFY